MNDDFDEDDHRFFWEEHASEAVSRLMADAQFDEIRGIVSFPPANPDTFGGRTECSSLSNVEAHLIEVYTDEWYTYVPFDGGEAVFDDDGWGAIGDVLAKDTRFSEFFETHDAPVDAESIVTAAELITDLAASRVVRVSVEEINDELIKYLASKPHLMREIAPRKFEELVAAMFRNQGYDVTLTPRSHDGGADVIAIQRAGIGTAMILVECKKYAPTHKVGVEIVRGLFGVVEEKRATRGVIATTSFFTRGAREFCDRVPFRLALADFDVLTHELSEWKRRIAR